MNPFFVLVAVLVLVLDWAIGRFGVAVEDEDEPVDSPNGWS